jgi:hypothetical protein
MSESISPKPPKPTAQYIMESVVDLVAIVALSFLTWAGKVPQWPAIVVIALLAGVRISDLGNINRPGGGPGGTSGVGGAGGLAGLLIGLLSGGTAGWHRIGDLGRLAFRAVAAASIVLGVAACSAGCYHRDGRAFTGPEYAAPREPGLEVHARRSARPRATWCDSPPATPSRSCFRGPRCRSRSRMRRMRARTTRRSRVTRRRRRARGWHRARDYGAL